MDSFTGVTKKDMIDLFEEYIFCRALMLYLFLVMYWCFNFQYRTKRQGRADKVYVIKDYPVLCKMDGEYLLGLIRYIINMQPRLNTVKKQGVSLVPLSCAYAYMSVHGRYLTFKKKQITSQLVDCPRINNCHGQTLKTTALLIHSMCTNFNWFQVRQMFAMPAYV